jgi:hypothetical protein
MVGSVAECGDNQHVDTVSYVFANSDTRLLVAQYMYVHCFDRYLMFYSLYVG